MDGLPITLTVVDGERSVEHATAISAAGKAETSSGAADAARAAELPAMLALALLGGLILNLMPCVLPVLSIKLLAVVGHGGGQKRAVRAGFLAAVAGILFSFMVLASALVAIKTAGHAIGWGLQFQQPWFLTAMILVVTLFACNLWGLFEVPLPRAFGLADERAGRIRGLAGHFLTGALATLLATPCSAPFLGTAIGFALSRGSREIFAVFAAVACGLALPYLAVAAFPALATRLPKAGPWMVVLRRILGLALAGTAMWLVWVLAGGIGWGGALTVGGIAPVMAILVAACQWIPHGFRPIGGAGLAALAFAAFLVPTNPPADARSINDEHMATARAGTDRRRWWPRGEPCSSTSRPTGVSPARLTSGWCCRAIPSEAAGRRATWSPCRETGRLRMIDIARYLAGFGRYGIPFDAVYGPALPHGEALPELLSAESGHRRTGARLSGDMRER